VTRNFKLFGPLIGCASKLVVFLGKHRYTLQSTLAVEAVSLAIVQLGMLARTRTTFDWQSFQSVSLSFLYLSCTLLPRDTDEIPRGAQPIEAQE
jgi:hypothetical protein